MTSKTCREPPKYRYELRPLGLPKSNSFNLASKIQMNSLKDSKMGPKLAHNTPKHGLQDLEPGPSDLQGGLWNRHTTS